MFNRIKQNKLLFGSIIFALFFMISLYISHFADSFSEAFLFVALCMPFAFALFFISIASTLLIVSGLINKKVLIG